MDICRQNPGAIVRGGEGGSVEVKELTPGPSCMSCSFPVVGVLIYSV